MLERYADIASSEAIDAYFTFLLYMLKDDSALDENQILRLIRDEMAFDTVGKKFHLIASDTRTVYIPFDDGKAFAEALLRYGPTRERMRALGPYAVSVYGPNYQGLDAAGALQPVSENAAVLTNPGYYHAETGLSLFAAGGEALLG